MSNIKISFIAVIAFGLGYVVSEYRDSAIAKPEPEFRFNHDAFIPPAHPEEKLEVVEVDNMNREQLSPAITGIKVSDVFSWSQVNQLIASARYAEAIQLLETRMAIPDDVARAWLLLASIHKKQGYAIAAVDAWFRYLKLEVDDQKIEQALKELQSYLLQLKASPALFNEDYAWLMAQFDALLKYRANDGEVHLAMAAVLMQLKDEYQAQYHALMAVNDPLVRKRAETILAKLNGENTPAELVIPLIRFGNQYLVSTTVEGYPARLLLDTGASLSGLSTSYTAKYPGLLKATKPIRLNTASGVRDSILFTVTHIGIGNLGFNQHILAQLPMDNSTEFDGLLGLDILSRFDFVIDQNAAALKLKPRKQ